MKMEKSEKVKPPPTKTPQQLTNNKYEEGDAGVDPYDEDDIVDETPKNHDDDII